MRLTLRGIKPDGESVVWHNPWQVEDVLGRKGAHIAALAERHPCHSGLGDFDFIVASPNPAVAIEGKIKRELREIFGVTKFDAQFFLQLAYQSRFRIFAGIDCAAEQPPVSGIENPGPLAAQLHQVTLSTNPNQTYHRVAWNETKIAPQKIIGRMHGYDVAQTREAAKTSSITVRAAGGTKPVIALTRLVSSDV